MSLRDAIATLDDTSIEPLFVPQWNVTVQIRSMTAGERAVMVGHIADNESGRVDFSRLYPDLVISCTFDPDTGEQAFSAEDREMLMSKNAAAIELIAAKAMEVSGLGPKAVEEAGKGSSSTTTPATTPSDGSTSSSPSA